MVGPEAAIGTEPRSGHVVVMPWGGITRRGERGARRAITQSCMPKTRRMGDWWGVDFVWFFKYRPAASVASPDCRFL